jgi:hypothetical protein
MEHIKFSGTFLGGEAVHITYGVTTLSLLEKVLSYLKKNLLNLETGTVGAVRNWVLFCGVFMIWFITL